VLFVNPRENLEQNEIISFLYVNQSESTAATMDFDLFKYNNM